MGVTTRARAVAGRACFGGSKGGGRTLHGEARQARHLARGTRVLCAERVVLPTDAAATLRTPERGSRVVLEQPSGQAAPVCGPPACSFTKRNAGPAALSPAASSLPQCAVHAGRASARSKRRVRASWATVHCQTPLARALADRAVDWRVKGSLAAAEAYSMLTRRVDACSRPWRAGRRYTGRCEHLCQGGLQRRLQQRRVAYP